MPVTLQDVRDIALSLPRAYEAQVREATKFRVKQIVFAAVSPDETRLGFGFPREEREGLVAGEPEKFMLPRPSDMRYQWVAARMEALEVDELRELIIDAWTMCVPKSVAAAYLESLGLPEPGA
ncbi:MmcQ/YjbR family DNA-binding protein [Nocardioides marmoriginsengisoli]|uniref:MmcQ/YjbR family DNA-binding protein n=1 Tax=Nocardioides marmoriginsengisoli TaxID=661483 RepID=A0A3N0CLB1_9ACTN|nr:MmcQ/YjbR family DNA-binding protein [Nocardioides marmoriginsengisoli]RNL63703.1 MmcQ/YjbR family DNA-binding protein [Nocardioides marmoriginsengisoli]